MRTRRGVRAAKVDIRVRRREDCRQVYAHVGKRLRVVGIQVFYGDFHAQPFGELVDVVFRRRIERLCGIFHRLAGVVSDDGQIALGSLDGGFRFLDAPADVGDSLLILVIVAPFLGGVEGGTRAGDSLVGGGYCGFGRRLQHVFERLLGALNGEALGDDVRFRPRNADVRGRLQQIVQRVLFLTQLQLGGADCGARFGYTMLGRVGDGV